MTSMAKALGYRQVPEPVPVPVEEKYFCKTCGVHTIKPVFQTRVHVDIEAQVAAFHKEAYCINHVDSAHEYDVTVHVFRMATVGTVERGHFIQARRRVRTMVTIKDWELDFGQ